MEWSDTGDCCFTSLQCVKWNGPIQVPVASPLFSVWNGMEWYMSLLLHLSTVCGMEWRDTGACCFTFLQCGMEWSNKGACCFTSLQCGMERSNKGACCFTSLQCGMERSNKGACCFTSLQCGMEWSNKGVCCFTSLQCVEWNGVIQVPVASTLYNVWNGMEWYRCLLLLLSTHTYLACTYIYIYITINHKSPHITHTKNTSIQSPCHKF